MRRRWTLAVCFLALLPGLLACERGRRPAAPEELLAVPHPELDRLDAAVRDQLTAARERAEELLAAERPEAAPLAAAMGELGRLYHAYDLLEPAAVCYRNAGDLAPQEPTWAYLLGVVEGGRGELLAAVRALERVVGLDPGDRAAQLHLGRAHLALDSLDAARRSFEAALGEEVFAAAALDGLGRVALAAGDGATAVERFREAVQRAEGAGALHHRLALALRQQGKLEEARSELALVRPGDVTFPDPRLEAVEELPITAEALLRRGGAALVNGQAERAVSILRRAVEADPEHVEARRNLALALVAAGNAAAALEELEQARRLDPDNVWVWFDLGTTREENGDLEGAVAAFEEALARASNFESARFNLANILGRLDRWPQCAEQLERLLSVNPGHADARYLAAMTQDRLGHRRRAVEDLRRLLADEPEHHRARLGLASLLRLDGHLEGAAEQYGFALELVPGDAGARMAYAEVLAALGRHAAAATQFGHVADSAPGGSPARLQQALALTRAGLYAEARQALELGSGGAAAPVLRGALARLLATAPDAAVRDGERGLRLAQRLYQERPSLDNAETLAMALAELGRFDEAARLQRQLLGQVEGTAAAAAHVPRLRANLAAYERREPIRME